MSTWSYSKWPLTYFSIKIDRNYRAGFFFHEFVEFSFSIRSIRTKINKYDSFFFVSPSYLNLNTLLFLESISTTWFKNRQILRPSLEAVFTKPLLNNKAHFDLSLCLPTRTVVSVADLCSQVQGSCHHNRPMGKKWTTATKWRAVHGVCILYLTLPHCISDAPHIHADHSWCSSLRFRCTDPFFLSSVSTSVSDLLPFPECRALRKQA